MNTNPELNSTESNTCRSGVPVRHPGEGRDPLSFHSPNTLDSGQRHSGMTIRTFIGMTIKIFVGMTAVGFLSIFGVSSANADPCTLGVGGVTLEPTSVQAGTTTATTVTTMTFTVDSNGILHGSTVAMRVPNGWRRPSIVVASDEPGYVSGTLTTGGGATLDVGTSNYFIIAQVLGDDLSDGDTIELHYNAYTCTGDDYGEFKAFARTDASCPNLTQVGTGFNVDIDPGVPVDIGFEYGSQMVALNTVTELDVYVYDCRHRPTSAASSLSVMATAKAYQSGAGYIDDPDAKLSLVDDPFSNNQSETLTINTDEQGTKVYYRITSANNKPNNYITYEYTSFYDPAYTEENWVNIIPVSDVITNVSVDNGVLAPNQNTTTITPNEDGNADSAYINFTVPDENIDWTVYVKNASGDVVFERHGWEVNPRISWEGRDWNWRVVPPGTYDVVISLQGGAITNPDLSIVVNTVGVTGRVVYDDGGTPTPLDFADVGLWGENGNGWYHTESNGQFEIYGLAPGVYNLNIQRTGYVGHNENITVTALGLDKGDIELDPGAVLRLMFTRPDDGFLSEIYGDVNAHNDNWTKYAHGNVHFANGETESDMGDEWNVSPTTYTDLSLAPGEDYTVELSIPNYGLPGSYDPTVNLAVGEVLEQTIALDRRANLSGTVTVPSAVSDYVYINVEAGPDVDNNDEFDTYDRSQFYWGHGEITPGNSSGDYVIFGIPAGKYLVKARVDGYVEAFDHVTVAEGVDATLNFPSISVGGSMDVEVTITGDTTQVGSDHMGGGSMCAVDEFPLGINAWSNSLHTGSWQSVCVSKSASDTGGTATLTGLADGVFEVYVHLPGFELNPPGPKFVTISGGTSNPDPVEIVLNQHEGILTGAVTLSHPPSTTIEDVLDIQLTSFGYMDGNQPQATITGSGVNYTYTFSNLGTQFYQLRAINRDTGYIIEQGVHVRNQDTTTFNLNLTGTTYDISGTVNPSASSPYNTMNALVDDSTSPDLDFEDENGDPQTLEANVIMAERLNRHDHGPSDMDDSTQSSLPQIDTTRIFYGEYAADGTYTISNLTPGTYKVWNNGELNNDIEDGVEVAQTVQFVNIFNSDKTGVNFTITDGYDVSGTIRIKSGVPEPGRNLTLQLQNTSGDPVSESDIYLTGTSANFTLERVVSGIYTLVLMDFDWPRKYSAKNVIVEVGQSNVTGIEVSIQNIGHIKLDLAIAESGIVLTQNNYQQYLSDDFGIWAEANPRFPGGSGGVGGGGMFDSQGSIKIPVPPGTYELQARSGDMFGGSEKAAGKKAFVPISKGGILVRAGQTTNIGTLELIEGISLTGNITDVDGNNLSNIEVCAFPVNLKDEKFEVCGFTNESGNYLLYGIDAEGIRYYNVDCALRPEPDDEFYAVELIETIYGHQIKTNIDMQKVVSGEITSIDFVLKEALGSVSGTVSTADGGDLILPFDERGGNIPGAEIIMNMQGNIPLDNPLGDIWAITDPDGAYSVEGLAEGVYDLWVLARGYGGGFLGNIEVGDTNVPLENIKLERGFTLSGTMTRPDGSLLSQNDYEIPLAIQDGFQGVNIGSFKTDAGGSILKYSISGFESGKSYTILLIGEYDEMLLVAEDIAIEADTEKNFVIRESAPSVLPQARKDGDGNFIIQFEMTKALRNSEIDVLPSGGNGTADDNEPVLMMVLSDGAGTLSFPDEWISSDRKRITCQYDPAAGETEFSITVDVTFVTIDPDTGDNYTVNEELPFKVGLGKSRRKKFSNARGGEITLEGDTSKVAFKSGTFEGATTVVDAQFGQADAGTIPGSQLAPGAFGASVMSQFKQLGAKAYPPEMAKAMYHVQAAESVDVFSSFYEIFLPASVSHAFPSGKEAKLCLSYTDSTLTAAEAAALNIYYYNSGTDEYVIESTNKSVDTDNQRICVDLAHASVFVVRASSDPVIAGSGYTGPLTIMNYPNPFDLKYKTVTLQDDGGSTQSIPGTMIKMSIPSALSGGVEVEIFNIIGEKVRTLRTNVTTGGVHVYLQWDGKNSGGQDVASGTYIGRFTINGENEKFFKMAVLK